jgi:hypothetical protein
MKMRKLKVTEGEFDLYRMSNFSKYERAYGNKKSPNQNNSNKNYSNEHGVYLNELEKTGLDWFVRDLSVGSLLFETLRYSQENQAIMNVLSG